MIAVLGSPYYAKKLVQTLLENNIEAVKITTSLKDRKLKSKLTSHKIIHYIGSPTVTIPGILSLIRFWLWKKKIFVTWIGTDTYIALKKPFFKITTKIFKRLITKNFVVSSNLADELNSIGLISKVQPFPFYSLYDLHRLPKDKKIAVYLPDHNKERWKMFQGDLIKKLVQDFPNVEFLIINNSGKNFPEKNVTCFQWVKNMDEVYKHVRGIIRLPLHDGLSNIIIEALSMGRPIISTPTIIPFCKTATKYEDIKIHLTSILDDSFIFNREAHEYVKKNFDLQKITKEIISIYN